MSIFNAEGSHAGVCLVKTAQVASVWLQIKVKNVSLQGVNVHFFNADMESYRRELSSFRV